MDVQGVFRLGEDFTSAWDQTWCGCDSGTAQQKQFRLIGGAGGSTAKEELLAEQSAQ